ncbi:MAG: TIGR00730 family Rossman fold protein [Planctomycetota bacterium]
MTTPAKSIAVYCSSTDGLDDRFVDAARQTGHIIASRGLGLVYGGGGVGLMGDAARAALEAGGHVMGVIPKFMVEAERAMLDVTEQHVVTTMAERKGIMEERADAFIALPGGVGTLDEIFEAITGLVLSLHSKPIVFVNIDGFYSPLWRFMEHASQLGVISPKTLKRISVVDTPQQAIDATGL